MALGDCYYPPCGSPLDFEQVLVGLFAVNSSDCMGMKIHLEAVSTLEFPCENLTLQQLILNSLVEDGAGGYALRFINVGGTPDCYGCGEHDDLESLLKSLFVKQGDCYGLKYSAGAISCVGTSDFGSCTSTYSVEFFLRNAIGHDATNGNYLLINELVESCATRPGCDPVLDWIHMMIGLVVSVDGECFSAFNMNAIDSDPITDVKSCGTYRSFEECFKASLSVVDCGYALNVFLISGIFREGEVL